jgi:hypothetical protein
MKTKTAWLIAVLTLALTTGIAAAQTTYHANLYGGAEAPPSSSLGTGSASLLLNAAQDQITVNMTWSGLDGNASAAHIHAPGVIGVNGPIIFVLSSVPAATSGTIPQQSFGVSTTQVGYLQSGKFYINIHSAAHPGGEIRGQFLPEVTAAIAQAAQIAWYAATGFHYQVQGAEQVNTNVWFDLGAPVPGNGSVNSYYDTITGNSRRFYRILTQP